MKRLFVLGVIFMIGGCLWGNINSLESKAATEELHIVLDAGHGGEESGAETMVDGKVVFEKDLNLKIAKYLKEELEEYEGVTVRMTRENDSTVGLSARSNLAVTEGADVLISIHNNAYGEICEYDNGCTVLVSKGQYREEIGKEEQKLGVNILQELSGIGVKDRGLLLRTSEEGATYPNGAIKDYYAIVNAGIREEIPAIIIEHAFMDNSSDYEKFLDSDAKLRELAKADARGIARYYQLVRRDTGEVLEQLRNVEETLVWVKTGKAKDNEVSTKIFYEDKNAKSEQESGQENSSQKEKSDKEKGQNLESQSFQENKEIGQSETIEKEEIRKTEAEKQSNQIGSNVEENISEQLEEQSKQNEDKKVEIEQKLILVGLVVILICAILLLVILIKRKKKSHIF